MCDVGWPRTHYVAQDSPGPPKGWDYRYVSPCSAPLLFFTYLLFPSISVSHYSKKGKNAFLPSIPFNTEILFVFSSLLSSYWKISPILQGLVQTFMAMAYHKIHLISLQLFIQQIFLRSNYCRYHLRYLVYLSMIYNKVPTFRSISLGCTCGKCERQGNALRYIKYNNISCEC
jgi:hypothetical protein